MNERCWKIILRNSVDPGVGVEAAAKTIEKRGLLVMEHFKLARRISRIFHRLQHIFFVLIVVKFLYDFSCYVTPVFD